MSPVELLTGLVAACVVLALIARAVGIPPAVALVLGGMVLAIVPGAPPLELDPHLALALFLPPLLQASAYRTDWEAFRLALRPILLLALGAVIFSTAAVAAVTHWLVPDLPWGAAIAFGAIVAPPDAVAATAVLKTTPIPRRLVTILEGESLLNDASSLILYRFAVVATAAGSVDFAAAGSSFVLSAVGGTLVGGVVGAVVIWVARRLDDTLLEIASMALAGFASYFAAELMHGSGVLAAVACGLVIGRSQHEALSARTRVESTAVWNFIEFVLTGLVFILIGLQLRAVLDRLGDFGVGRLALLAFATSFVLIASRFVWVFGSAGLAAVLPRRLRLGSAAMPISHLTIISWAGMRGVVSLAAAVALPQDFPGRDLIVFLAFCAILVTLVLQGTTLSWLIRVLRVAESVETGGREAAVRLAAAEAALKLVEDRLYNGRVLGLPDADMLREHRRRVESARALSQGENFAARQLHARARLELDAVAAARRAVLDRGYLLDGEELQSIEEEFDFEENRLARSASAGH